MSQITPILGIGERIRNSRQDRRLTLEDLALATGIARSTISRIERGQDAKHSDVLAIAAALGLTLDELHRYEAAPASNASAQQSEAGPRAIRENQPTPSGETPTPRRANVKAQRSPRSPSRVSNSSASVHPDQRTKSALRKSA